MRVRAIRPAALSEDIPGAAGCGGACACAPFVQPRCRRTYRVRRGAAALARARHSSSRAVGGHTGCGGVRRRLRVRAIRIARLRPH